MMNCLHFTDGKMMSAKIHLEKAQVLYTEMMLMVRSGKPVVPHKAASAVQV